MKITNVECLIIDKNFPYVLVETDEGITGVGECFRRAPLITKSAVEYIFKDIYKNNNDYSLEHVIPQSLYKDDKLLKKDMHNILLYPNMLNIHRSNYKYI